MRDVVIPYNTTPYDIVKPPSNCCVVDTQLLVGPGKQAVQLGAKALEEGKRKAAGTASQKASAASGKGRS
jgi:hypothetical protein